MPVMTEVLDTLDGTGAWSREMSRASRTLFIEDSGTYDLELNDEEIIVMIAPDKDVTLRERSSAGQVHMLIKDHARVKYYSLGTATRFACLAQGAHIDWVDIADGRSESTAYLATGASAKFRGLFIASGDEQYDVQVKMIHAGSRSSSNMLTRAALLESSKGRYRGLIRILPQAKGCEAHQREDTLVLGDKASMDAIPILEIENNDVRCSHGVTLGQVDDDQLFYLQARGIGRDEATTMLVQGFFDPLLISIGEHGAPARDEIMRKVRHG